MKKVENLPYHENPNLNTVKDVSIQTVQAYQKQLRLIDVRRPDEWVGELGHIENAELMTLDTLPQRWGELNPHETIVFICRSGARSAQAAAQAQMEGFQDVFNMAGGMIAWNQAQYKSVGRNKQ